MRRNMGIGIVAVLLVVAVVPLAVAQEATPSLKTIVSEIERQQNVQTIDQINPNRVGDEELAQLGEAVMDQMVPNEREHAYMDQMMGGEGSETLEAMHRAMGYNYLASGGRLPWGTMPFGPGMRGYGFQGRARGYGPGYGPGYGHHMFGYMFGYRPGVWWILPILVILLVIAVVVLAVLLAVRRRRRPGGSEASDNPLEILKRRYARGEISREEYKRMLEDLK